MRIWCDVWDPSYTIRVGDGPLEPLQCGFKRKLDEAGAGAATFAITPRTMTILRPRYIVEIHLSEVIWRYDNTTMDFIEEANKRMVGAFIIDSLSPSDTQMAVSARGPGVMVALQDKIALPGLAYENQSVSSVLSSLGALAGWTIQSAAALDSQFISMRFAGENIQRALAAIAEAQGIHFRQTGVAKVLAAGAFGDGNALIAEYMEGDKGERAWRKHTPMEIESANVGIESQDVVNKVYVFGGGEGDAAVTIEGAQRSFVDSEFANGRNHYFIADNGSIALYGQIERRINIKRIFPTDASDSALQNARDALADAGKAWLDRHVVPYESLKLKLRNVRYSLTPGDKLRVRYRGLIDKDGLPYLWRDIDTDYWIMSVDEQFSADDVLSVNVEVANIDRYVTDAGGVVAGMVDAINVQQVNIQPYPAIQIWGPFKRPLHFEQPITFSFPLSKKINRLNSIKMTIYRDYWSVVSGVASGGGDHRHLMFKYVNTDGTTASVNRYTVSSDAFGGDIDIIAGLGITGDLHTWGASGAHTHALAFDQINQDDQLPAGVSVQVNNVQVASGLWSSAPATEREVEIDITAAVKSVGDVRTSHNFEISCNSARGDILITLEIDADFSRVRTN